MIRRDDLQYEGLILYQDTKLNCFSEDAVLLANFVKTSQKSRAIDLGTGNGIIAILAAKKTGAEFIGIDIQDSQIRLAKRSAEENHQKICFKTMRIEDAPDEYGYGSFDCVVMNPPFFSAGDRSTNSSRRESRHADKDQGLPVFLNAASKLLRFGGKLFVIYPLFLLTDLLVGMRQNGIEPKRVRIVKERILTEGRKGSKPGLVLECPEDGKYVSEKEEGSNLLRSEEKTTCTSEMNPLLCI